MKRAGAVIALICLPAVGGRSVVLGTVHIGSVALSSSQTRGSIGEGALADSLRRLQESAYLSPEITFDTRGVEFGIWIRRLIMQLKRNWLVPYGAMALKGHVAMTFYVH